MKFSCLIVVCVLLGASLRAASVSGHGVSGTYSVTTDVANSRWLISYDLSASSSSHGDTHFIVVHKRLFNGGTQTSYEAIHNFAGPNAASGVAVNWGSDTHMTLLGVVTYGSEPQEFAGETLTVTREADAAGPVQGAPDPVKTTQNPDLVRNPYNKPLKVEYKDGDTGEVIATETIAAGQVGMFQLSKTGDADVNVQYTLPEGASYIGPDSNGNPTGYLLQAGTTWAGDPIPDSDFHVSPPSPTVTTGTTPKTPSAPVSPSNMIAPGLVPSTQTGGSRAVVVGSQGAVLYSTGTQSGTGGVTDASFREGTGAVVTKLGDIEKAVKAGNGSGSGTDMGPTNEILQEIKTNTAAGKTVADLMGYTEEGYDGMSKGEGAANNAIANANEAKGTYGVGWGLGGEKGLPGRPTAPNVPANMESAPPALTLGLGDAVNEFLGPAVTRDELLPWFEELRAVVRNVILWGFVLVFMFLASQEVIEQGKELVNLQPWNGQMVAPENYVPLVGVAKHKLIATAAVVGIVAAWGLIIGYFNTELSANNISPSSMFNLGTHVGGISGDLAKGLNLAAAWFPFRAVLQLGLSYIALRWLGLGTIMATAIYLKFMAGCIAVGFLLLGASDLTAAQVRFVNTGSGSVSCAMGLSSGAVVNVAILPTLTSESIEIGAGEWWFAMGAGIPVQQTVGFNDVVTVVDGSVTVLADAQRRYGSTGLSWAFWSGFGVVMTCGVVLFVFMTSRKALAMTP